MSTQTLVANIYNPQNQTKEQLIDSFVVRLNLFKRLFKEIEEAKMEYPEQHYLIVGRRGMGKTTLLLRLKYEVENSPKLSDWLIPLIFNEEEYSIRKLYKFWERVIQLLEQKETAFTGLSDQAQTLSDQLEDEEAYERALFDLLEKSLHEHKKKIILFIDNVWDMFEKFSEQEAHRLRKILQTSPDIRIFAASSKMIESFYKYEHPFYEFFKIERLRGLGSAETAELLKKLGEAYNQDQINYILAHQKGRVESLRRLTGGVIRTVVLMYEIFTDYKNGNAFNDLEILLDRVTPLYKHRMDDLPAQQQEIVEIIALAWDAVNVSEIRQKSRMDSKTISAQLQQLMKNEIVTKIPTSNKNHLYQITERFFNIWYLMRNGRAKDRQRVIWLVRFFEEWCDEREIIERVQKHIEFLKKGEYNEKAAYWLTEALAQAKHLPNEKQHELIETTKEFLIHKESNLIESLSESDLELNRKALIYFNKENYKDALHTLLETKEKNKLSIALCFLKLENYQKAQEYLVELAENGNFEASILLLRFFSNFKVPAKYVIEKIEINYKGRISNLLENVNSLLKIIEGDHTEKKDYAESLNEQNLNTKNLILSYRKSLLNLFERKENSINYNPQVSLWIEEKIKEAEQNHKMIEWTIKLYLLEYYKYNKNEVYVKKLNDEIFKEIESIDQTLTDFFIVLIAKNQHEYLYKSFSENSFIKERFKPIYYALMYHLQDKYPNEYLRMGEELKETVEEILQKVAEMREKYK